MFDVDGAIPDTPAPRGFSQNVQALISDSLDFLDKAHEELKVSKPKFFVINFWIAVEISLKVPLVREHWLLACGPKEPVKKQTYLAGNFQSVTHEEIRERSRDVLEEPLGGGTGSAFDKVRKYRNRAVYFCHPTFTEVEQRRILKEQADTWSTPNRLLRDEQKVVFGIKRNWKLAFGETRLIRGNKFYAEVRLKQVKPELKQLSKKNIQIGNRNECYQHATVTGTEATGNENRKLEVARCKVCTSTVRQIILVCPDYKIPQLLPEGDSDFECEHCDYTSDKRKLLDEELFHSVDERLLSVFPTGCTNCMTPESVYKFGDGYFCTQCSIYYTEPHVCGCCGHLSDSVPELSRIRGCEFYDGDQCCFDN